MKGDPNGRRLSCFCFTAGELYTPVGAGLVYHAAVPAQIKARKPLSPTFRSEQLTSFFLLANGKEILQKGHWLSHLLQIS